MPKALVNARLFDGYDFLEGRALIIEDTEIKALLPEAELSKDIKRIDMGGATVAPGFIDLQINGCGGVLFNDDISESTLSKMHRTSMRFGATSIMPTLITSSKADMVQAVKVATSFYERNPGAIMGLHLEGPHISKPKRGAHNAKYIRPLDETGVVYFCVMSRDIPIVLTVAPEECDPAFLRRLARGGVRLSLGHTNASYDVAAAAIADGARFATHLFNAMSPLEGRNPGVVGAVLNSSVYAGIIVDGMHSSFHSVSLAKKIKGDRLYIVTDAVTPMGTDMKEFPFADQMVKVVNGKCVNDEGALAGSAIDMMSSVRNAVLEAGIEEGEALRMASLYPARAMGVELTLGALRPGMAANLVAYRDWKVTRVMFQGNVI